MREANTQQLPLTFMTTIFTLPIAEFQRVVIPEGADFPPTAFIRGSYIWKFIGMSTLRIVFTSFSVPFSSCLIIYFRSISVFKL